MMRAKDSGAVFEGRWMSVELCIRLDYFGVSVACDCMNW